jgi:seryl-tRNA synthetase
MLDLNLIRQRPDWVTEQIAKRNTTAPIADIVQADSRRRTILQELEQLRREVNTVSKEVGARMGQLRKAEQEADSDRVARLSAEVEEAREQSRLVGERVVTLEAALRETDEQLRELMLQLPNLPHPTVPVGPDESANLHHPPQGAAPPVFDFVPKPHWELGVDLGLIDFERGVKLSGSRFYLLRDQGARLQRALIQFMLDLHVNEHGLSEVYLPFIVKSLTFEGAGQLPKFFDNIYRDAEEDFMLLATAEVALTNLHRDEILEEESLPRKYVAYTPCFRREKMSAGKDVRGIKRGHQFDKVEMYQFVHPDQSDAALEELRHFARDVCERLGFHYRIVELATGDVGFAMTKTYDIEVWAAGCQEWLEVSSISNAADFQARRCNTRFRPKDGGRLQYVHTLNASGLALPRVMIAILENNQQADGSIIIPEVLRPWMGGAERIFAAPNQ